MMNARQQYIEEKWNVSQEHTPHLYWASNTADMVHDGRISVDVWREMMGLPPIQEVPA